MSWQPPPSFASGTDNTTEKKKISVSSNSTTSSSSSTRKSAGENSKSPSYCSKSSVGLPKGSSHAVWAPPFVVGSEEAMEKSDHQTLNVGSSTSKTLASTTMKPLSTDDSHSLDIGHSLPSSDENQSKSPVSNKNRSTRGSVVNWNETMFVVNHEAGQDNQDHQIPSRQALGHKPLVSRKDSLIVDQAMRQTRLEWNQLVVSKAFQPYGQMICAVDDDLPDPDDLEAMEEDNQAYFDGQEHLLKIRDEMLNDPDFTEREIASFFEGFKLFQFKVNSLKSQIDGLKAMQRVGHRSFVIHSRPELRKTASMASPVALTSASAIDQLKSTTLTRAARQAKRESTGTKQMDKGSSHTRPHRTDQELSPPKHPPRRPDTTDDERIAQPERRALQNPSTLNRSLRTLSIQRVRQQTSGSGDKEIQRLLEELEEADRRQKKLEKQLAQAGVVIAEDIPYQVAKEKVESIARRMGEIGGSDNPDKKLQEEYFHLEREMEKYTAALQLTDEWAEEQEELEQQWEDSIRIGNEEAIKKLRRHMPVDVRNMSEAALSTQPSPNGKVLPATIAKKFKRTNVLQLLRIDPEDMVRMHPSTLENMRVTGLTLTERRALYQHLKDVGPRWKAMQADKMTERKWTWFNMMKTNFKENVDMWQRHVDQYGPPGNHPYASRENPHSGCPLIGKQCPLKADKIIDYDGDYGFPEGPVYFKTEVKKSDVDNTSKAKQEALDAAREKKAMERSVALKKHYKGKILQVSLANGSCEAMDESMDKMEGAQERWLRNRLEMNGCIDSVAREKEVTSFSDSLNDLKLSLLQFAERSGMQLTGKRDANAGEPDGRSMIELALCEEVLETAEAFFTGIEERMKEIGAKDGRMKSTIQQLRTLLEELHERNLHSIKALGQERPPRSRKLKTIEEITKELKKPMPSADGSKEKVVEPPNSPPNGLPGRGGRGGRGDLMAALQGRGRGGPGRGGLMAAIAARGGNGS